MERTFDLNGEARPSWRVGDSVCTCADLIECVDTVGFLPMFESGIEDFSADAFAADECRYQVRPDGSWVWPLWRWKGPVVTDGGCVYGKFFAGKAGFVSRRWWPDFCNWRRHSHPLPPADTEAGMVMDTVLQVLREGGSMVSRDLRKACGLTGPRMRSVFDRQVALMQMGCRIVTEDFVYPRDRHGHEYGWGLSLLTTPERLLGTDAERCDRTPEESLGLMAEHLKGLLPWAKESQIMRLLK